MSAPHTPQPEPGAPRLAVLGENVMDLIPRGDEPGVYRAVPGGGPANIAVAAARLGTPTAFLARFGSDGFGATMRERLAAEGIGLDLAVTAPEPSALALTTLGADGQARYDFWMDGAADWQWSDAELAAPLPDSLRLLSVGSVAAFRGPGAEAIERLLARERDRGRLILGFDPNVRPAVIGDPDWARARYLGLAGLSHVVKASDEDLRMLHPGVDEEAAARQLLGEGAALVVVTAGAKGSRAFTRHRDLAVPAPAVDVQDTIGAGDTFMGALLHTLARLDVAPDAVGDLGEPDLRTLLTTAGAAAAVTCTRSGAQPPTEADLAPYLR
ncbi:carbohydrate kinase [Nocardiopsis gilva]|nr:carbohydrate kinase [Nocardiopsis gilva]